MTERMDDPGRVRGSSSGGQKYIIYLIMGIFVMPMGLFGDGIKTTDRDIATMMQLDDSVIMVYNMASNPSSDRVDLYLCLYLIWVPLMMGMIFYNVYTAMRKIQLMVGCHVEVARVLVAAYMAGLVAACLIVPFMIGWAQPILTVVLGAMIAHNSILDRRDSECMPLIQKGQVCIGIAMCMTALIEVTSHVYQITGLGHIMLGISMGLVLATAILTIPVKNGDTCKQSGDRRV